MASVEMLTKQIGEAGERVRKLKSEGADFKEALKELLALKETFKKVAGHEFGKKKKANGDGKKSGPKKQKKKKKKKEKKPSKPVFGAMSWTRSGMPVVSATIAASLGLNVTFEVEERNSSEPVFVAASDGTRVFGDEAIGRYFCREAGDSKVASEFLGGSLGEQWTDFALRHFNQDAKSLLQGLASLNIHLATRNFMVGSALSIADLATLSGIQGAGGLDAYAGHFPNVERWYANVSSDKSLRMGAGKLKSALLLFDRRQKAEKKQAELAKKKAAAAKAGNFKASFGDAMMGSMPDLEHVTDPTKVVTRFPPEPSGYMHIGHVKAATLNHFYAHEKYKGKMILRFDDTNPNNEKGEYVESIKADLKRLGIHTDMLTHTSDHFDRICGYARKAIKDGLCYMDKTPHEEMKKERLAMVESKYRNQDPKETAELFEKLWAGTKGFEEWCLRIRIPTSFWKRNSAMRDPVIYRMNTETPHHRTKRKYKAYPTYDFACPIVDAHEGVTHAMRTTEYMMRDELYHWLQKKLGVRHVYIQEFARLNFTYTVMSKRKLRKLVEMKEVDGWTDPRFPTVRGVLRRGVQVPVLKNFILSQGFSTNNVTMEWDRFWSDNARYIDKFCPRYMAVGKDTAVTVHVEGMGDNVQCIPSDLHPKDKSVGEMSLYTYKRILIEHSDALEMKVGDTVTAIRWGNMKVVAVDRVQDVVKSVKFRLDIANKNFKKTQKISWVADVEDLVKIDRIEFDHLITKPKIEEGDVFEDILTSKLHPTKAVTPMLADPDIRRVKEGEVIQLFRVGFFRCDSPHISRSKAMAFFQIPDGKQKAMSTLTSKLAHR